MSTPSIGGPSAHDDQTSITSNNLDPSSLESDPNGDLSNSPFAKMFPSGATKEQLQIFVSSCLKSLVSDIKRDQEHHKKALERQRRMMEGEE